MWSIRNPHDVEVWREIEATSDRITAIVSAVFVEERLSDAIKHRLLRDPKQIKKLFDPDGPLGSYDAKVALGYLLNVYVDETRRNLLGVNGGGKPGHMPAPESASSGRCFLTVGLG